ncbi:MAG: hypothetical protein IMF12_05735 [Proteobacteria bacterium]|nr:hypothetical protein [Pseudomonadota bacterium]
MVYVCRNVTISSLGEPTLDLIQGLWGALIFSIFSLIGLGWLTLSVGCVIGCIYEIVLNQKVFRKRNAEQIVEQDQDAA